MENLKPKTEKYQQIIQQLLLDYATVKPAYGDFEVETIFDTQRHHYQVLDLGWEQQRWVHHCPIHLAIRQGKVWIFRNTTEQDIAAELVILGIPKQDIVLGFYPPFMREMSDYAVS